MSSDGASCVLAWSEVGRISLESLVRALIPLMRTPPSSPRHPSKCHPLGDEVLTYEFGGERGHSDHSVLFLSFAAEAGRKTVIRGKAFPCRHCLLLAAGMLALC